MASGLRLASFNPFEEEDLKKQQQAAQQEQSMQLMDPNSLAPLQAPMSAQQSSPQGFSLMTAKEQAPTTEAAVASGISNQTMGGIGAGLALAGNTADPHGMGPGSIIGSSAGFAGMGASVGGPVGAGIGAALGLGLGLMNQHRNKAHADALMQSKMLTEQAQGLENAAKIEGSPRFRFGGSGAAQKLRFDT